MEKLKTSDEMCLALLLQDYVSKHATGEIEIELAWEKQIYRIVFYGCRRTQNAIICNAAGDYICRINFTTERIYAPLDYDEARNTFVVKLGCHLMFSVALNCKGGKR